MLSLDLDRGFGNRVKNIVHSAAPLVNYCLLHANDHDEWSIAGTFVSAPREFFINRE